MRRRLGIVLGAVAVLLAAVQLGLPWLAERMLRGRLERIGRVEAIDVEAFPAPKLLWRRADRVAIRMAQATTGTRRLAELLADTRGTARLDARVGELHVGPLVVRDARLVKRGRGLAGQASVTGLDLRAAMPPGLDIRPVASRRGQLTFQVTADLLGRRVTLFAVAAASEGRLVVAPAAPFASLLTLTVFADPRVVVVAVGAHPRPDGFTVVARARLRE